MARTYTAAVRCGASVGPSRAARSNDEGRTRGGKPSLNDEDAVVTTVSPLAPPQAIALESWFSPALIEKAKLLIATGDWEQALETTQRVLAQVMEWNGMEFVNAMA